MTSAVARPVLDMTEHEHRDRALADAIAEHGRFTIAG